jgi:hypothetical protein
MHSSDAQLAPVTVSTAQAVPPASFALMGTSLMEIFVKSALSFAASARVLCALLAKADTFQFLMAV